MTTFSPDNYSQWPLRMRSNHHDWTISYHDSTGKIIHIMNAENQIGAFRSADKLATLYQYDGDAVVESGYGIQLLNVKKLMHPKET